ncbi:glycoside hydrolase family 113 [Aureispira anguillae]|uniref:Glycoside hydrolase n=1 Tax=Aureispira anguillae TaxID=2864201 RepID=A0A915YDD9_9BACT|nr:hypothetical protein [Aureispira anguillae]BDS11042.1 hypothetical protein AsAng_0017530 [Aureispira anguillae]
MRVRFVAMGALVLFFSSCSWYHYNNPSVKKGILASKINGMAIMAPPSPFRTNPMPVLKQIGINWISIQPFAFFYKDQPDIQYSGYQWWGERPEGLIKTIELARKENLSILLKPQLWAYNQWVGDLAFEKEEDWVIFEDNYRNYILPMVKLADSLGVELFSVGTEMKRFALQRPEFWRALIEEIRTIYTGKLVYAANWDNYHRITFWDALDYIGVDAYFPLTPQKRPTVNALKEAWMPTVDSLHAFYKAWGRPVLFTEFGYMSLEACAYKAWLLEQMQEQAVLSEQAQANALQALLETFGEKSWWAGGFQWKWYVDLPSVLTPVQAARDYTPQGKKAMKVLEDLYKK